MTMIWIESEGGPLVCIPNACISQWQGVADESTSVPTDYERACAVIDWAGIIPVGPCQGLVLGDEPMPTYWKPADDGGSFVRWVHSATEDDFENYLRESDRFSLSPTGLAFTTLGDCKLFDAAIPGFELEDSESLSVSLQPGVYSIRAGIVTDDSSTTCAVVVRLVRRPPDPEQR